MLILLSSVALAGPWIKSPGQAYVKASSSVFRALDYVDPLTGELQELDYQGTNTSLYAEVGVARGLQVQASVPWATGRSFDAETGWLTRSAGPGDAQLGLGLDIPRLELPASLSLVSRVPLYDQSTLVRGAPALGDENLDLDLVGAVGHSLPVGQHWLWLAGTGGFRWRTAWTPSGNEALDVGNGVPLSAQIGLAPNLAERSLGWLSLDYSALVPLVRDEVTRGQHQLGAGIAVNTVAGLHLEASGAWIVAATNASTGWSAGGGLSWKR
jgi:hypothetical protein